MKMNHKKDKKVEKSFEEKPKFEKLNLKDKAAEQKQTDEERQITLALAMQYQYYTESEEEEEEEEGEEMSSTEYTNCPPPTDNSAW
jgi:hypothetical protein